MIQVIVNPEPLPESASLSEAVTWNFGQWPPNRLRFKVKLPMVTCIVPLAAWLECDSEFKTF
jgi:hypothetical protein